MGGGREQRLGLLYVFLLWPRWAGFGGSQMSHLTASFGCFALCVDTCIWHSNLLLRTGSLDQQNFKKRVSPSTEKTVHWESLCAIRLHLPPAQRGSFVHRER